MAHQRRKTAKAAEDKKKRARFLASLERHRCVAAACRAGGFSRATAYRWRDEDAAFAEAWDDSMEAAVDELFSSALERATRGTKEPIFNDDGKITGHRIKHETALTIFMLKALRPDVFHLEKKQIAALPKGLAGVLVAPAAKSPEEWIAEQQQNGNGAVSKATTASAGKGKGKAGGGERTNTTARN